MDTGPKTPTPPDDASPRGGWPVFLATGAWIGLIPWAPGTFGTLWGVLLAWGIGHLASPLTQALAIVALAAAGIPLCTAAARRMGGVKDPGAIVFDEIAAVPVTFFLIPLDSWTVALLGFALFRLFDITKPPPARQLERLPEGLGIMADDLAAGTYSCLALHLVMWIAAATNVPLS